MKFLIDQPASWMLAKILTEHGHDAIHVRDVKMSTADDSSILERAANENRIIITQDMDFGKLLAMSGLKGPSVIQLRLTNARPDYLSRVMLDNLPAIEEDLQAGAIVVISDGSIRIRKLPIP